MADGNTAIGEVGLDYFIELQQAVAFGEKGHAAIVDQSGHVIAHPKSDWMREVRDLSKVSVVQKMMNGESGVTRFYSPAMEADMVAGFSVVDGPGWGGYGRYGYGGYGGYYGGMGTTTTRATTYTDGTLILDAYEPGDKQLVWRGTGTVTLKEKPEKINKQIDNIFSKMGKKWQKILQNEGR